MSEQREARRDWRAVCVGSIVVGESAAVAEVRVW